VAALIADIRFNPLRSLAASGVAGFVVLHCPSKAPLRQCGGFPCLPKTTVIAGHAMECDGREYKGACRALHLRGLESTKTRAAFRF